MLYTCKMFIYEYGQLHLICTVKMICDNLWYCTGKGILYAMCVFHTYTLF